MVGHALFGELRSLLQRSSYHQDELLQHLAQAYEQAPAQYVDQWRPYLGQHDLPRIRVERLSDVPHWRTLLPDGTSFEFKPYGQPLEQWLNHPALAEITHLDLSDMGLGVAGIKRLVQQARVPRVRWLNLSNNQLTVDGLKQLCRASWRSQLRWLNLYGNNLGDAGVDILANDDALANLQALHLGANKLKTQAYTTLANSDVLANLIELNLVSERLDSDRLNRLFDAPTFLLESLSLGGCKLKDDAVAILAQCPQLSRLKHLSLGYNAFGHAALAQLAMSPYTNQVVSLELSQLYFEDADAAMLALRKGFDHLQSLNLSRCGLGAASLDSLEEWGADLHTLVLSGNQLGDRGAQRLARLFPSLTTLELFQCGVGELGMAALGQACGQWSLAVLDLSHNEILSHQVLRQITSTQTHIKTLSLNGLGLNNQDLLAISQTPWTHIQSLSLAHNEVSDHGVVALASSEHFKYLRELAVGNHVGDQGALALAASTSLGNLAQVWMMKNQITNKGTAALERSLTLKQGARIDVYECPCDVSEVVVGQHETVL